MLLYEKIILIVVFLYVAINGLDFLIYIGKSSPKRAHFSKLSWRISFLLLVGLIYMFIK